MKTVMICLVFFTFSAFAESGKDSNFIDGFVKWKQSGSGSVAAAKKTTDKTGKKPTIKGADKCKKQAVTVCKTRYKVCYKKARRYAMVDSIYKELHCNRKYGELCLQQEVTGCMLKFNKPKWYHWFEKWLK